MRRSAAETEATRRKLVEAAARLVRDRGTTGASIGDLMAELDMTTGGFYRHFDSKDALIAEAIEAASAESTRAIAERGRAIEGQRPRWQAFLDGYLGREHVAHRARGCPVAALAGDIGREGSIPRKAFGRALRRLIDGVESLAERRAALHAVAAMVGAVILARAAGAELGQEILDAVKHTLSDHGAGSVGGPLAVASSRAPS